MSVSASTAGYVPAGLNGEATAALLFVPKENSGNHGKVGLAAVLGSDKPESSRMRRSQVEKPHSLRRRK